MTSRFRIAFVLLAALLGSPAAAYKPLCKDSAGRLVQCAGTLDNTHAPAAIAAGTITGTLGVSQGGTGATSYTSHGVIVADGLGTGLESTNAPTTPGQHLIWDGAQWLPGIQTGTVYYFRRDASDIGGGYEQITQTPQTGAEKTAGTTLNNASGTVVFDTDATNAGEPGLTQLLAGTWEFDIYGQVSSTAGGNTTNIVLQFYKRTTGGVETLLFSTTSPALDSTSPKLYSWLYTQPSDLPLGITDRLVVKVAATNSSASNRTVTFYYEGTSRYSHFHPPFLSLVDAGSVVTVNTTQTITGAKTFSVAPVMSGANITSGTIGTGSIAGGSANRIMIDGGTTATWSNTIVGATISCASNTCTNLPASALSGTVGVGNGGTGKNTWTVGSIPVATGVTTIAEIAPGTAGQVLTSNGAGAAPSMAAPVTSNTASSSAGASYTLSTNAYEAVTSLSVPLAAGTWSCQANVRSVVRCSAGAGYITLKLYNVTAAADVANSERIGTVCGTTGQSFTATTPISEVFTIGSPSTIQVYAVSPAGATYTERTIYSDSDGRSRLVCHRLA